MSDDGRNNNRRRRRRRRRTVCASYTAAVGGTRSTLERFPTDSPYIRTTRRAFNKARLGSRADGSGSTETREIVSLPVFVVEHLDADPCVHRTNGVTATNIENVVVTESRDGAVLVVTKITEITETLLFENQTISTKSERYRVNRRYVKWRQTHIDPMHPVRCGGHHLVYSKYHICLND